MIVEYPGPAVTGQARTEGQYLGFFGISLEVGANTVGEAVGRQLLDARIVQLPSTSPAAIVPTDASEQPRKSGKR